MAKRYPVIAREGWGALAVLGLLTLVLERAAGVAWAWPSALLLVAFAWLFRDPRRSVPALPLAIVSPVDGVITKIEECDDPCLPRRTWRISLCMWHTGAYSVRSPIEGKVMKRWQDRLVDKSCDGEEHRDPHEDYGIWIQTDEGDDVLMLMPGGNSLRHPRFYIGAGERVGQGERCGFVSFGSRMDVLVPASARVGMTAGSTVRSGESVLATLVHHSGEINQALGTGARAQA